MLNIGISAADFLRDVYEKNYLFCRQAVGQSLIDWPALDEILLSWDPGDGLLKLFREGPQPLSSFAQCIQDIHTIRMAVSPDLLREQLHQGATVVMDRIDRKASALANLCGHVASLVLERTVANGYIAFGGTGTFGKHWDTHDVFAVQLIGRKRWRLFRPTFDLPLRGQPSSTSVRPCPEEPVFDQCLEAGDVLYIPRGWWHEASPLENHKTFHLAIGVHTARMVDYCQWVCMEKLGAHLAARQTFKVGDDNRDRLRRVAELVSSQILDDENMEVFERKLAEWRNRPANRSITA